MGFRRGPSPQDVQLAEPADLEAVQAEPSEHAPEPLASLEEELDCQVVVMPLPEPLPLKEVEPEEEEAVADRVLDPREGVEVAVVAANYVPDEEEADEQGSDVTGVLVCPSAEDTACETASSAVPLSAEEPNRPEAVITLEEEDEEVAACGEIQVERDQKVNIPGEREPELPAIIELDPASPPALQPQRPLSEGAKDCAEDSVDFVCLSPASASACNSSHETVAEPRKPLVPCYWSLELLIAAAFCTDVPPFPLFPYSPPSPAPLQCTSSTQGMELLSELADLELQQQKRTSGNSQGEGQ